mmetsp:Transcript_17569/g.35936  ORF Transcript_17569/g.35936 Transcript_17569/m.35936 type:complete len:253 (+) Transcript_17569:171-929(+)
MQHSGPVKDIGAMMAIMAVTTTTTTKTIARRTSSPRNIHQRTNPTPKLRQWQQKRRRRRRQRRLPPPNDSFRTTTTTTNDTTPSSKTPPNPPYRHPYPPLREAPFRIRNRVTSEHESGIPSRSHRLRLAPRRRGHHRRERTPFAPPTTWHEPWAVSISQRRRRKRSVPNGMAPMPSTPGVSAAVRSEAMAVGAAGVLVLILVLVLGNMVVFSSMGMGTGETKESADAERILRRRIARMAVRMETVLENETTK